MKKLEETLKERDYHIPKEYLHVAILLKAYKLLALNLLSWTVYITTRE